MVKGKGDRHAQQKRRRKNNKDVQKQESEFLLVDGNYSCQPYMYCCWHKGFLTRNQAVLHKCREKECQNLKTLEWAEEKQKAH